MTPVIGFEFILRRASVLVLCGLIVLGHVMRLEYCEKLVDLTLQHVEVVLQCRRCHFAPDAVSVWGSVKQSGYASLWAILGNVCQCLCAVSVLVYRFLCLIAS